MSSHQMKITADIFAAHLKCPMKCWLRTTDEPFSGSAYTEWARTQSHSYRTTETELLVSQSSNNEFAFSPSLCNLESEKWRTASSILVQTQTDNCILESELHAISRVPATIKSHPDDLTPIRFIFTNKLGTLDKLLLGFDAFVLSKSIGRSVRVGKIIHGDDSGTLRVSVTALINTIQKHIEKITALLSNPTPPELVLNRHCPECEFRDSCHQKALKSDDLSLLSGMPVKDRAKHRSKGIFSVTQLSFTFRPRRKKKCLANKPFKYDHALKALAIRENKIHIAGNPSIGITEGQVYLDVEGTPDQDFYYLIGLRVKENNSDKYIQHSLWANNFSDERNIWLSFLKIISKVENPRLVHYGSYETTFLNRMRERYADSAIDVEFQEKIISSAVNLLSIIYGQVYFPTFSNGLKEIARYLGYTLHS